jgi:tetratricopeptide (TPR) repeat protein
MGSDPVREGAHAASGSPDALLTVAQMFNHAIDCHQAGRLGEAEQLYRATLRADPTHFGALHNLGVLSTGLGRPAEAVALLRQALARDPNSAMAHNNLGNALQATSALQAAIACYDRALAIEPTLAEARNNRGNALLALKRFDAAIAEYQKAVAINPRYAEAHYHWGHALQQLERHGDAIQQYERALALRSNYPEAHNNIGNALLSLGRAEEAIGRYERALAVSPGYAEAHINLASTLMLLNRAPEAVARSEALIRLRPDFAEAHTVLGRAFLALNRAEAALEFFERAGAIKPDYAETHWYAGQARLLLGDFEMGWRQWERRLLMPSAHLPQFSRPQWSGAEDLAGKTILLYAEPGEGFGDTIQFVRYVPLVARRGARVVLQVQAALAPLLRGLEGVSALCFPGETLPDFDLHSPLMSLPFAFGTTMASIPALPYLSPPTAKVAEWRAILGESSVPRIGVAWSGRPRQGQFRNRALPLQLLAPMLEMRGVRFVAIQKDLREGDTEILRSLDQVQSVGGRLADFADAAAAISLLDLVITVDTSVAHLAGALGKPVWIMLQFAADWRWLTGRDDNPWYPSARLFRQPAIGDWESVAAQARSALQAALPQARPL